MSTLTPCLSPALGAGLACFGLGAARRIDPGFKMFGAALSVLAFTASPALADQFVEVADNARIDCVLSRGELTRIALVGDGFANVSKIASAYPYNDFTVTHEPVRGDIYISVPPQFAADRVREALEEALAFLTGDRWNVSFTKRRDPVVKIKPHRFEFDTPDKVIMPYSDGLDSRAVAPHRYPARCHRSSSSWAT